MVVITKVTIIMQNRKAMVPMNEDNTNNNDVNNPDVVSAQYWQGNHNL